MPQPRYVVSLALFIYCMGIVGFALSPIHDVGWAEWFSIVLASLAALGLIAHALPSVTLPLEEYAYLITGYVGFTTLLLYLVDTDDPSLRRSGIALLLLSGAVGGYGAFLAQEPKPGARQ